VVFPARCRGHGEARSSCAMRAAMGAGGEDRTCEAIKNLAELVRASDGVWWPAATSGSNGVRELAGLQKQIILEARHKIASSSWRRK